MINKSRGFTLIEILVVIMIIAIIAGASTAFISTGGPEKEMKDSVEQFVVIADHIREMALLSGEPIGLQLEPPQWRDNPLDQGWLYSWKKMTPQGWVPMTDIDARDLPVAMELFVILDELQWKYEKAPEIKEPQVAFYPSGEVTPFEIEFTHTELPGQSQTVMVDVWGDVMWKEREEAEKQRQELEDRYD